MNKLTLIAATLLTALAATAASAQALSRADVLAELQRARASGELDAIQNELKDGSTPAGIVARGTKTVGKTRAEVVAELQRARETGELEVLQAEGGPDPVLLARVRRNSEALLAGQPRSAQ